MASVYLCEDLKHDRKVALKLLKPELAAVLGAERFVVEIKTTASLQHPHILPLFDSGTADGFLFYVMPFIEGETLRDKLNRETQLGVDEAVRIAREVLDALLYAHEHGIVHRDVKPENILLHGGHAMVADFGIALAVSAAAGGRMTETGLSLGTPHYMSPEQATAEKEITARSDVYSLGSVLYEMLTGQPPHLGGSAQQIIMRIITDVARPVTEIRKAVPPNIAAAVAKSLEKLPADRFESAKAFSDALANASFTSATFAGAAAGAHAAAPKLFTRPFIAVSVLAAASLAAAVWGWRRPEPPREVSRFSIVTPDSQAFAAVPTLITLAVSPDGRRIAYVGRGATLGVTRLWIRAVDQLQATPLGGTENAGNPVFSPDGKHIAFTSTSPRAIRVVAVGGGPVVTLADSLVDLGGVSWASDGYVYYDGHLQGDGLARVRDSGGGKPEVATMPDTAAGERYHNIPTALPNGRGVLFRVMLNSGESEVAVLDPRTGKHKILAKGVAGFYAASGHLVYVTLDGTMMAAPFDLDRLTLTAEAVPVAAGLAVGTQRVDVAMSTNGLLVYAAGAHAAGGVREVVWVTRDGTATPVDAQWTQPVTGRPALSPDGKTIAVATGVPGLQQQLWIKRPGLPAVKLSDDAGPPAWSPDGKTLVFTTLTGMWFAPADGSSLPVKVRSGNNFQHRAPEYSRDGKWIVHSTNAGLFAARTDGDTALQRIVADQRGALQPALSPDGRWIAYMSAETGVSEIYVRPFPDWKSAKRQVSSGGGIDPRWSRDGRELFYRDPSPAMIAVPVMAGAAFATGVPKRLFSSQSLVQGGSAFDVSADGQRFLMSRAVGAAVQRPDELVVVQNFFEELRAKAPVKK
jgi:Tol biopolymer transport system component